MNKSGIAKGFIRASDLRSGELSVWRISRSAAFGIEEARLELDKDPPNGNAMEGLYAAAVERIRKLQVPGGRAFCVLDDCATDDQGNWHEEHAVVALADEPTLDWSDADLFDAAREGLHLLLVSNPVWKSAA